MANWMRCETCLNSTQLAGISFMGDTLIGHEELHLFERIWNFRSYKSIVCSQGTQKNILNRLVVKLSVDNATEL